METVCSELQGVRRQCRSLSFLLKKQMLSARQQGTPVGYDTTHKD